MFHLPFYCEVDECYFLYENDNVQDYGYFSLIQQKQKFPSKPANKNKFAKPTYYL